MDRKMLWSIRTVQRDGALIIHISSHHLAPARGGGEDEPFPIATKQLMVQKWSILWRSIIASSLDATLFPYCRYIKTLDFRDLGYLLEDEQFKGRIPKYASQTPSSCSPC